ncbi:MAG: lipid-binding protein [Flavobacteriaceae bacterium]|nr:lipid-binding protein [Flavobacteriaceae bacterium]
MKTNFVYAVFLLSSFFTFSQTNFNLEKSKVKWTGKKITNASHWGHINFTKAEITFDGDVISTGNFIVDMTSISVDDISGGGKSRLENHLKDDDFFSVDKFNNAELEILEKSEMIDNKYQVEANLTIKGITNPITFEMTPVDDGSFKALLVFDRSTYDVQYRSGSFFENLGDRLILDDVVLEVNLIK